MQFSKQTKRAELKPSCSPGPGAYEPKLPSSLSSGVLAFDKQLVGDRNETLRPDGPLSPRLSPPPKDKKEKVKESNANERKFSWATEKIHTLTSQLDAANAKLKVSTT